MCTSRRLGEGPNGGLSNSSETSSGNLPLSTLLLRYIGSGFRSLTVGSTALFLLSAWACPVLAQGVHIQFQTVTSEDIEALDAASGISGARIVAGSGRYVYWTHNSGLTWTSQRVGDWTRDLSFERGGLALIASSSAGLLTLEDGASSVVPVSYGGHYQVLAVAVLDDGTWVSAGPQGVSMSSDRGMHWSPVDSVINKNSCCTGHVTLSALRDGSMALWTLVGAFEINQPRLLYSWDQGRTWADSSNTVGPAEEPSAILSTSSAVELRLGKVNHSLRETWDGQARTFSTAAVVTSADYSPGLGVVVGTEQGLFLLDEDDLTLSPLWEGPRVTAVAVGPSGQIYVAEGRTIWEVRLESTSSAATPTQLERVNVFPNPARHELTVLTSHVGSLNLWDPLGRSVLTVPRATRETVLHLHDLAHGIYFLVFNDNQGIITTPVVILP